MRAFSAKTPSSAPELGSRCQISGMRSEGMGGLRVKHTHTHTHAFALMPETQTMQRHTQETYLFEAGQMFYLTL